MMDGRVGIIRESLDESGYEQIPIMSYTVKYAQAFTGLSGRQPVPHLIW